MSALPVRSFMDGANTKWRHGYQPNYDVVNEKFMAEKTMNHKDGSLEQVVENLVKTWEMESSHKMDAADWKSVDKKVFTISSNGGKKFNLDDNISIGNYNILMCESPLYNAVKETNQSSHDLFRNVFTTGFAWEVLQVFSGPPLVSFTWRHWGTFEGDYKGTKATGETIEMYGNCVVKVNDDMKIQSIDVYYDPNPFLMKLTNWKSGAGCPVAK
eukprot:XP_011450104.2 PREDICTED: pathogen-related protein [Crassostrea gigas]